MIEFLIDKEKLIQCLYLKFSNKYNTTQNFLNAVSGGIPLHGGLFVKIISWEGHDHVMCNCFY